jgi:hypothetical protein
MTDTTQLQQYITNATVALQNGQFAVVQANLSSYYAAQTGSRGYATLAGDVVNNTGIDGQAANSVLQSLGGVSMGSSQYYGLMVKLATSDFAIVQSGATPTMADIETYHIQDYQALGIAVDAWGGASSAYYGIDWSGGLFTPAELNGNAHSSLISTALTPAQAQTNAAAVLDFGANDIANLFITASPEGQAYVDTDVNAALANAQAIQNGYPTLAQFYTAWKLFEQNPGFLTQQISSGGQPSSGQQSSLQGFAPLPVSTTGAVPSDLPPVSGSSGWSITWTSPGIPGDPTHPPVDTTEQILYYDASANQYVTASYAHIAASSVTDVAYNNAGVTVHLGTDTSGSPNGSGVSAIQGVSGTTLTDLQSGNQVTVAGTVDTSTLQPGQPVAVSTAVGTYHIDPATGDITDSGAVTATINGQTVTLLGLGGPSPFALISNDNSAVTASAVSSNVLAYPRWSGAASMTPQPLSRRVGPCRISPVGGNRKARRRSSDRLCGFDVREGRVGGGSRCRAADWDRSSGGRAGFFEPGRGLVEVSRWPESAAISVTGHTRRLPVSKEAAKLSGKECRSAHRCRHDVSILAGGLG